MWMEYTDNGIGRGKTMQRRHQQRLRRHGNRGRGKEGRRQLHPIYGEFGRVEYVDSAGRQYRVVQEAESGRSGGCGLTVLFVRNPIQRRRRDPLTGRLPARQRRGVGQGYGGASRWPRSRHNLVLYDAANQRLATGRVSAVWTASSRSAVARMDVRDWRVDARPLTDPSPYMAWGIPGAN